MDFNYLILYNLLPIDIHTIPILNEWLVDLINHVFTAE